MKYTRLYRGSHEIYPIIQEVPRNIPDYTGGPTKYTRLYRGSHEIYRIIQGSHELMYPIIQGVPRINVSDYTGGPTKYTRLYKGSHEIYSIIRGPCTKYTQLYKGSHQKIPNYWTMFLQYFPCHGNFKIIQNNSFLFLLLICK